MDLPILLNNNENIEVSWEVFMSKNAFTMIQEKQWNIFKNPRNCASWTLRQLDPLIVANRHLSFFAYEIRTISKNSKFVDKCKELTQFEKIKHLDKMWFPVEKHSKLCTNLEELSNFIDKWTKERNNLAYEIDWVVIKLDSTKLQNRLWSTAKSPRWAIAFKFPAKLAQSEIKDIILQVWRTWVITPVAILTPVMLDWSTISRATLHNFDEIKRLDARIWDTVIIEKAWDVIPKVNEVLLDMRPKHLLEYIIPEYCLDCWHKLSRITGEVAIKCTNHLCNSKHLQSLIHFCSRNALNIEGCWDKVIILLSENNLIDDFADLFTLRFWDLFTLPSFKEKKAKNLLDSINKSKNPNMSEFIFWLWIPFVWEETSQLIANFVSTKIKINTTVVSNINEQTSLFWELESNWNELISALPTDIWRFIKMNNDKISNIEWIWDKVAESIGEYFNFEHNIKLLEKLENVGLAPKIEKISNFNQIFDNKIFVLTGALPTLSREKIKEEIKKRGGWVSSSVSKNTDYVIAWENPWEKLEKANKLWTKVLNEKQFLQMITNQ